MTTALEPITVNKENVGFSRLYSPSKYTATKSRGVFGLIMSTHNEVHAEEGEKFAKKLQLEEEKSEKTWKAEEEARKEQDKLLAEKLAKEEADAALAAELMAREREEMRAFQEKSSKQMEEDLEYCNKIAMEEALTVKKEKDLELASEQYAHKLIESDLKAVSKHIESIKQMWKKPKVVTSDSEEGIKIELLLPAVKDVNVVVDQNRKEIFLQAKPDLEALCQNFQEIPEELRDQVFDATVDLKIVGKNKVTPEEVVYNYDPKTYTLTILVQNARLRKPTESKGFLRRVKTGFRKVFKGSSASK